MTEPTYELGGVAVTPPPPPQYARRKVTPAQGAEIRRRYADGESAPTLALEFGVSVATIGRYTEPRGSW